MIAYELGNYLVPEPEYSYIMLVSLGIWIFSSLMILTLHSYQTTLKSTFQSALQVDLKGLKNPQ